MHDLIVTVIAIGGYFTFSAAIGAMYPPDDSQKRTFYGWLYRFLQAMAANADKVMAARYGGALGGHLFDPPTGGALIQNESSTVVIPPAQPKP